MDTREFSNKLAGTAKTIFPEEKASLMKMFEAVSDEITKIGADQTGETSQGAVVDRIAIEGTSMPDGITARLRALKDNYLTHKPTITTHRARAITKVAGEDPGMPEIMLRAKCSRCCCETAPLVVQDRELIVGAPRGAPRAGAFSPDITWRWMEDEIDTVGSRPQDPLYISEEDKKIVGGDCFRSGGGNPWMSTARTSTAKPVFGNFPVSPLFPVVPTTH